MCFVLRIRLSTRVLPRTASISNLALCPADTFVQKVFQRWQLL